MEGLRPEKDGEPGVTWAGLEVKSGTESMEGVLAMMEGEICKEWGTWMGNLKGRESGRDLVKTLGPRRGKCLETEGLEEESTGLSSKGGFGGGVGWGLVDWRGAPRG